MSTKTVCCPLKNLRYIEMITALAQLTGTPYSEVFAAQAETLRDLYVLRGTPLPREIRRWQEARA